MTTSPTIKENILIMQPMPTVAQVFRLFTQEERHKELSLSNTQNKSLVFTTDMRQIS